MNSVIQSDRDVRLMDALLEWRRNTAMKFEVPVFYILQEKTLRDIVKRKPLTLEGLLHIDGIAEVKLSYFGSELLEVLEAFLFPGERALKDYASSVPVKSCCHLCHSCDSVTCPGCGVVHSNPHTNWSTTNSLLYQIKPGQKQQNSEYVEELKKRKTKSASDFVMKMVDEMHCPLNQIRKRQPPVKMKENVKRVDEKSVEVQKEFLKKMAQQEIEKGEVTPKPKKKAQKKVSSSLKGTVKCKSASRPVLHKSKKSSKKAARAGSKKKKAAKMGVSSSAKKTETPRTKEKKRASKKKIRTPKGEGSSVHLDKSFWDMASKVKKRAREALKKRDPAEKKPKARRKRKPPRIAQECPSPSTASTTDIPLSEEPPNLDTCSIPVLKKFLSQVHPSLPPPMTSSLNDAVQNGFTCPVEINDASELRALAKNSVSAWEVRRVLSCEKLPLTRRHRVILRLKPGDDNERMRSSYRKLSLLIHPDKNCLPEASHAFYLLQSALQYLSAEAM